MPITPEVASLMQQMSELFAGMAQGTVEGIVVHDRAKGLQIIQLTPTGKLAAVANPMMDETGMIEGGDRPGQSEITMPAPQSQSQVASGKPPRVSYKLGRSPSQDDLQSLTELGRRVVQYLVDHKGGATNDEIVRELGCAPSTAGNCMTQIRKRSGLLKVIKLNKGGKGK